MFTVENFLKKCGGEFKRIDKRTFWISPNGEQIHASTTTIKRIYNSTKTAYVAPVKQEVIKPKLVEEEPIQPKVEVQPVVEKIETEKKKTKKDKEAIKEDILKDENV